MPSPQTLERFIAMVERNDHAQACELFYTEHSTMQENQGTPRVGVSRRSMITSEASDADKEEGLSERNADPRRRQLSHDA